jgi:glycosyltransferase involved in cell wall biosynthesis
VRVLVISHPSVAPRYRRKFDLIAEMGEVRVRLVVPQAWPEEARRVVFEPSSAPSWAVGLPVVWEGYYARYFYRRGLARQFRDFRPDIVHVEEEPYSICAGQALWMAKRYAPTARFIFRTSLSTDIRLKVLGRPFLRAIERRVLRRADAAFVLSERAAGIVRRHGYTGRIYVFPNGVDTRIFRPLGGDVRVRVRREVGAVDGFLVGYVGRLAHFKGIEDLVEAVARTPGTRLLLVGDGELRPALSRRVEESGLGSRALFVGAQPPERVAELVHAMDVLVLPSRTSPLWVEFFGRALAEAMACGVPAIGSSSGEIAATLGDGGLVFPEGDVGALCQAIERVRGDAALRDDLRERGLARVRSLYAWEAVAQNTLSAYVEVLGRGG